jgi:hypothetical protein
MDLQFILDELQDHEDKINSVYSIFKDFYGEDRVDLVTCDFNSLRDTYSKLPQQNLELILNLLKQSCVDNCFILVYFPEVTVTNEFDQYTNIYDLYAKVKLGFKGTILDYPTFNRSTYTKEQYINDYMHSHVISIDKHNHTFQKACFGRGPIINTIGKLLISYDEYDWNLFCLELQKYVETESIQGVPYHRLASISLYNKYSRLNLRLADEDTINANNKIILEDFIKYILDNNKLEFAYSTDKGFTLSYSDFQKVFIISNLFIEWWNTIGIYKNYPKSLVAQFMHNIFSVVTDNCHIYTADNISDLNNLELPDVTVLTFKNRAVKLKLINSSESQCIYKIINPKIINYIVYNILFILNVYYGNAELQENSFSYKFRHL